MKTIKVWGLVFWYWRPSTWVFVWTTPFIRQLTLVRRGGHILYMEGGDNPMSRGTRQETLIRSLIEGLCLTLEKHYQGQTRQKPKLQAVEAIKASIEDLWKAYPIKLSRREAPGWWHHQVVCRLPRRETRFQPAGSGDQHGYGPGGSAQDGHQETSKQAMVGRLNQEIQALYDTFDRQGAKMDLLIKGAEFADKILAREI